MQPGHFASQPMAQPLGRHNFILLIYNKKVNGKHDVQRTVDTDSANKPDARDPIKPADGT